VRSLIALLGLLPWPFIGRLGIAFTEITLSVVVLASSVIVGHELKAWRDWFWDPVTTHPWAPTPRPSSGDVVTRPTETPAPTPMPIPLGAASALGLPGAVALPTNCRPLRANEQLVFTNAVVSGADCVRTSIREDGVHLIVDTYPAMSSDFGVVAVADEVPTLKVFAPVNWPNPVLVIRGTRAGNVGSALVLTWQARSPTQLLGVSGQKIDVSTDGGGWPRLMVTPSDGAGRRMYIWTGSAYSQQ